MGFERIPTRLASGRQVTLVAWEDLSPPAHGDALQAKPWNDSHKRKGVEFYDSTIQYMRNDWARAHMSPAHVSVDDGRGKSKDFLLFHNAATDTWHSADALDIDHVKPWKAHLTALKVDNYADANRAYNDVGNLRLLPSAINRARTSFENMLDEHGGDSPEMAAWVKKKFAFDATAAHPAFDEGSDLARRTQATTGASWDPEDGRKGLSFDARVLDKWFDNQLKETYVATVELTSPTTGKKCEVPLFQCPATRQLVTRDAFDIDHEVPFETLAKEMVQYAEGGTTKAHALDAYNETSNLRLVTRSANSSHEWELNQFGQYRDASSDLSDDDLEDDYDRAFIDDGEPEPTAKGMDLHDDPPSPAKAASSVPVAPSRPLAVPDAPMSQASSSSPPLVSHPRHADFPLYDQASKGLQKVPGLKLTEAQHEGVASSLALVAKAGQMTGIDGVLANNGRFFAVQSPDSPARKVVSVVAEEAVARTVEQNTSVIDKLAPAPKPGAQAQAHSHSFPH